MQRNDVGNHTFRFRPFTDIGAWRVSSESLTRTRGASGRSTCYVDNQNEQQTSGISEEPVTQEDATTAAFSPPGWLGWAALVGIALIAISAGIGRLLKIGRYPGGMADTEASYGLLARQSDDFGWQWMVENAGDLAIPLVTAISWVASYTGFDAETPRIAAALFGAGSILATGLWLNRAMGPIWGLAGAAVIAGSFWHILFSRLGIGQIAGAFGVAMLVWLLTEASARQGSRARPWYVLAGIAAGIAFLSAPGLRLIPLIVLGGLVVALIRLRQQSEMSEARNWLFMTAATYLTISPFLIANRGDLQLWTPWTPTPGLPGSDVENLSTLPGALIESVTSLAFGADARPELNLPLDPWFSLLMLPWALIGIPGLISASNRPELRDRFLFGTGLAIAVLIGISAIDAGHPGQLVLISPALAALAAYGFKTALTWARVRTVRYALGLLIIAGIIGDALVSFDTYESWARSPATQAEFQADVTETIQHTAQLDTDEPIFVAYSSHWTRLEYFRTPARRHTFDSSSLLPILADEDGYLVIPRSNASPAPLAELLDQSGSVTNSLGNDSFFAYRLDDRLREELPFSVPTVRYPNGPEFYGSSDLSQQSDSTAYVLLAWKMAPDSSEFTVETRLRPTDPAWSPTVTSDVLPPNPLSSRLYVVLYVEIDIPTTDVDSDLEIRVRRDDGTIIPVADMDEDGFILLNRYIFQE
jgi:hypothetical protein